ncbi:MAG TPA: hypothetical protein VMY88_06470 [Acidimicrobiales bacterium]|nr:hypothetical protein [Acidimicrobiales bacterium]
MARTKWTAALLLTVMVFAGGCGKNGEQVLAAAGDATAQAGTSRMSMTVSAEPDSSTATTAAGGAPAFEIKAEGLINYETGHGIMTMDMGALGIPGAPAGDAEMRMLGSVVYMKMPGSELGNRPWIKFDLEALGESGAPVPSLNPASNDPRGVLDALRGVSGEVQEVGEQSVRGVATTHYRATVDLEKAQDEVPKERRDDFAAFSEQLGIEELPIDVWVDEEGRARRFAYEVETPAAGGTPASQVDLVIELFDFGVDVEVKAPPESEVTDYGEEIEPAG